ncbi:Ras-related protein Rab-13 [Entamoeba marina]
MVDEMKHYKDIIHSECVKNSYLHNQTIKDLKIIVLGDEGVGKTTFINNVLLNKQQSIEHSNMVEINFTTIELNDVSIPIQLFDIPRHPIFPITNYLKGCHIILCFFDLTQPKTFEDVEELLQIYHINHHSTHKMLQYLIGNKKDIHDRLNPQQVSTTIAGINACRYKMIYVETSALETTSLSLTKIVQKYFKLHGNL